MPRLGEAVPLTLAGEAGLMDTLATVWPKADGVVGTTSVLWSR